MYQTLMPLITDGTLRSEVEATYPLERVREALAHTTRAGRTGRIVLTPVGSM